MTRFFAFLATSSEKRPWTVILCVGLMTVFLVAGMGLLKTEFSQEGMMPKKYESVKAIRTLQNKFGGISYENALIVSDDVTSGQVAGQIMALSPQEMEKAGIKKGQVLRVETYLDALKKMAESHGMQPPSGMFLGIAVQQFLQTPYARSQVVGKTITKDNKATIVKFQIDPKIGQTEQIALAKNLERFLGNRFQGIGAKVYVSGVASMQKDAQDFMMRQTSILFGIALLFIMLVLYMTFRRVSDVFLLMFVIVVGIVWVIGLMGWVGITYTTMSVAIMPLMLGINIAYVIHILSRYYEEREAGEDIFFSATTSVKTVGVAVFLTAITTVFGFSSFLITDIPPMRDFGLVCMIGISFSFLLALTLLPAVIVIRDGRKKADRLEAHLEKMKRRRRETRYGTLVDKALVNTAMAAHRRPWAITAVVIALVAFAGFAVANVKTGADIRSMMPSDLPSVKASAMVSGYFGAQDPDVILVKGDVRSPENLRALMKVEDVIAGDRRNDDEDARFFKRESIISIADVLAGPDGTGIPATKQGVEAALSELGKQMNLSTLVSDNGEYSMIMVMSEFPKNQDETAVKTSILRDAARSGSRNGLRMTATGISVLISDLLGNIVPTQLETSGLALLLCLAVLILVFRSFFYGLVTLVVVICGMSAEMVFLYLMGWPLDIMTVTVASLVIGAGIDFGIHITHRYREQHHDKGLSVEDSIKTTVLHVGRALIAGALTTAGVFGILGISTMVPLRHFGWTTAVGLLAALLGALFVLPSLLVLLSKVTERAKAVVPVQEVADKAAEI